MNKTKFLELVKNPDTIEEKDLTKLDELISEHPYSQIIHVLNVKGRKAFNKPDFEQSLNLAATYTYDRSLLQSLVDGASIVPVAGNPTENDLQTDIVPVAGNPTENDLQTEIEDVSEETSDFSWIHEGEDEDDIFVDDPTSVVEASEAANNTISEHEDTGESQHQPEQENIVDGLIESLDDPEKNTNQLEKDHVPAIEEEEAELEADLETDNVATTKIAESELKDAASETSSESASSKQEIEKDDDNSDNKVESQIDPEKEKEANRKLSDPLEIEIASGGIHAELMRNLNQLQDRKQYFEDQPKKNGGPKSRKEQIEIIDNFIKSSPVLSKPNLSAESEVVSQDDLSKNSTQFSEELASENLAKIYLKQGKRKDAEKIYKKLMVKFPQKKAYFADRIQKLKKK